MAKVVATQRGYFGRMIREPGDTFDVPDEIMADEGLRPSWVELVKGRDQVADAAPGDATEPAKPEKAKPGPKAKAKPETVAAPTQEPFIEAPQPVRVENEINAATGATQPDWVAPAAGGDI